MQLKCLGSSSSGNCYLLENETECLILEAGIPFKEVKKALDFNISKVVGVLITHEHGDHAGHCKEFRVAGFPVHASQGTIDALGGISSLFTAEIAGRWYPLGGFLITPFSVIHDAAEPFGFVIRHQDMGTLLFASDTEYVRQNFKSLKPDHIMIECNYSQKLIDERMNFGDTVKSLRDRVIQSHMELETCKEFIKANQTSCLDNVVLLHLSDGNSDEAIFEREIRDAVGTGINVFIADKGLTIDLKILPFM